MHTLKKIFGKKKCKKTENDSNVLIPVKPKFN